MDDPTRFAPFRTPPKEEEEPESLEVIRDRLIRKFYAGMRLRKAKKQSYYHFKYTPSNNEWGAPRDYHNEDRDERRRRDSKDEHEWEKKSRELLLQWEQDLFSRAFQDGIIQKPDVSIDISPAEDLSEQSSEIVDNWLSGLNVKVSQHDRDTLVSNIAMTVALAHAEGKLSR